MFREPPGGERPLCLATIGEFFWNSTGEPFVPIIELRKISRTAILHHEHEHGCLHDESLVAAEGCGS